MILLILLTNTVRADCPDLSALTKVAREEMFDSLSPAELSGAFRQIQEAKEVLLCASEPLPREQLAALFQTGGTILAQLGREPDALAWMTDAARLAPGVPFDTTLTSSVAVIELYDRAIDSVREAPRVEVRAPAGAVLDGWPISPGTSRTVPAGEHVVQLVEEAGLRSSWVLLDESTDVGILPLTESQPQASPRIGSIIAGVAMVSGGVGLTLWGDRAHRQSGWFEPIEREQELYQSLSRRADIYTFSGIGLIGAGTATLIGSSISSSPTITVTRRW